MKKILQHMFFKLFSFLLLNSIIINSGIAQYRSIITSAGNSTFFKQYITTNIILGDDPLCVEFSPLAKFHIKNFTSGQSGLKIDLYKSNVGFYRREAFVNICQDTGGVVFGIIQIGTSEVQNYFQNPVTIGRAKYQSDNNFYSGITLPQNELGYFIDLFPSSGPGSGRRLLVDLRGIKVYGNTETEHFQLTTSPGYGKVLVSSDNFGNAIWVSPSTTGFMDNDWLVDTVETKSSFQYNLYEDTIYANVGIGTKHPKSKLHVADGNILISQSKTTKAPGSQNGSILFGEVIDDGSPLGEWGIEYFSQRDQYWESGLNFWKVYTDSCPGGNAYLFIRNDGNIGIGTLTPQAKLAVNGKIVAKEMEVTLDGFPDYVFKPGYPLRPLDELESYIKNNQHLPDLPTEEQVKADGLNLGEMNSLLVKKLEEMTLYIIELKKEVDQLKARLDEK